MIMMYMLPDEKTDKLRHRHRAIYYTSSYNLMYVQAYDVGNL